MGRIAGVTVEDTRQRLLDAAAEEFATEGYAGAGIAAIARRAGMSTGAIYSNYRSKAELLAEAIRSRTPDELERLLGPGGEGSVATAIAGRGATLQRRAPDHAPLLVEAVLAARRDPDVATALTEQIGRREALLAELIRTAQAEGQVDPDLPADAITRFCVMVGLGSLLVDALDLPPTDDDDWSWLIDRLVGEFRTDRPEHDPLVATPTAD
jgi:AcrR family transcriptional regulator